MRRWVLPALVVSAAAFGAAAPAGAVELYPASPAVAVGADGTEVVTWSRITGVLTGSSQVLASLRPAGGGFSAPVVLGSTPEPAAFAPAPEDVSVATPRAYADAAGDVLVTWLRVTTPPGRDDTSSSQLVARWHTAAGWSPAFAVTPTQPRQAAVALSADGTAFAVWDPGGTATAQAAVARPGAAFGAPQPGPATFLTPQIAATSDGGSWVLGQPTSTSPLRLVRLGPDGDQRGSVDLTPPAESVQSALGVGPDGSAVVAWRLNAGRTVEVDVVSATGQRRSAAADLGPSPPGDEFGYFANFDALGESPDGSTTLIASVDNGAFGQSHGLVVDATPTGSSTVRDLAGVDPQVAATDSDGSAVALGTDSDGRLVGTARPAAAAAFSPLPTSTAPGRAAIGLAVALSRGRAVSAWLDAAHPYVPGDGPDLVVLDGAGRTTIDVPVPAPATPRRRVLEPARTAQLSGGRLRLRLRCPGEAGQVPCRMALAVRRQAPASAARVGPVTVTVPAGARRTVSLAIPARVRGRYARAARARVELTAIGDPVTVVRAAPLRIRHP